jgi:hypothetical protein
MVLERGRTQVSCTSLITILIMVEYSKLVAVTGLPGLFELINSKADGAIVRSLDDKSTRFISNRVHQFSQLETIEVYTVNDNVNLVEIFQEMDKSGAKLPDEKDSDSVKAYFEKVYADMDFERVYNSDMKKMVKWFAVLQKNKVELKLTEIPEEEEEAVVVEEAPAEKEEKAPAKKSAAKKKVTPEEKETAPVEDKLVAKKAAPRERSDTNTEDAKKPAKKAAPKKKS